MNWLYSAAGLGPFQNAKMVIESSLGFDKKSLHILVGFVIFALIRWVFKCRIRTALAAVLAAALLGEVLDIYELIISGKDNYIDNSVKDIKEGAFNLSKQTI